MDWMISFLVKMKRQIDFLIIGAQKSGTTSLYHYLGQHPDIFVPNNEENRYFTKNEFYQQGDRFLKIFYKNLLNEKIIGGKNVHVLFFPHSVERIHSYNSDMKLIAVLRNPIDRAYSAFWFARRNGWEECETFEEALKREPIRANGNYTQRAELTYLTHGHYYEQLERILMRYDWSNIRVILYEDLRDFADEYVRNILMWLGADYNHGIIDVTKRKMVAAMPKSLLLQRVLMSRDSWYRHFVRKITPAELRDILQRKLLDGLVKKNLKPFTYNPMLPSTRKQLVEYFAPHNDKLAKLINRDLGHWK